MLTPAGNFHHSKLPPIGAIVTVRIWRDTNGSRWRRFIVAAYPLTESLTAFPWRRKDPPDGYPFGIHTVIVRALDNGEMTRVSGHWCIAEDES